MEEETPFRSKRERSDPSTMEREWEVVRWDSRDKKAWKPT